MFRVLCVEDEVELRDGIVEVLQDEGYETEIAGNGTEALKIIAADELDLVLCDINMPEMSGYNLLSEVRKNYPRMANVPFIFLTALADREHVLEGLRLGAEDYITKPIDFEMLLAKIKASLRQMDRVRQQKQNEQVKLYKALVESA